MTALPPVLISILQPCVQHHATHVDVRDHEVVLFKGESELGRAEGPPLGVVKFAEMMRLLSTEMDGEQRHAEFQTPQGKLFATVTIDAETVSLVFAADSPVFIQTRFDQLLDYAAREGVQKLVFTAQGVPMWKDGELIGVGEIEASHLPAFIAHAREKANMQDGEQSGTALLMGEQANVLLRISISERSGQPGIVVELG